MPAAAEPGLGDGGEAALPALSQLLLWFEVTAVPVWPFSSCPFDPHNPSTSEKKEQVGCEQRDRLRF